jgi:hypothetical protein
MFLRHVRALLRRLQDVRVDGVIMTCKLCRQMLQYRATVQCYSLTGQGYAVDRSPRGKTDKISHAHTVEDIICYS